MEKVQPRTVGQEMMTQDNEQKMPTQMPGVENYAGNESGETVMIPGTGQNAPFQAPTYLNIDASEENRSAKFKYGEGGPSQDVPEAARNQYQ